MGCTSESVKCSKGGEPVDSATSSDEFNFDKLEEKGRLQFFFHSPESELPIRDVSNEQRKGHKTEPHIEIGAENYISCCYQPNNIVPFLKSKEKYLFLFTRCKKVPEPNCNKIEEREAYIVGYISKGEELRDGRTIHFLKTPNCETRKCKVKTKCDGRYAVRGKMKLFSFSDAYQLKRLIPDAEKIKHIRMRLIDKKHSKQILDHFKSKRGILLEKCVDAIKGLDKKNKKKIQNMSS